jgi:hypothetical protein
MKEGLVEVVCSIEACEGTNKNVMEVDEAAVDYKVDDHSPFLWVCLRQVFVPLFHDES